MKFVGFIFSIGVFINTSVFGNQLFELIRKYIPHNPVIVDCGCYDGRDSAVMANYWPKSKVLAFEPVPELYNIAKRLETQYPNILVSQLALGDKDCKMKFYVSEFKQQPGFPSASSSLLPPKEHLEKAPHVVFPKVIEVDVVNLDSWAEKNNIDHVDFMWLDMQGYELNMIKSSKLAQKAKVIWTEITCCEAYEGQYQFDEMLKWMTDHDFVYIGADFNHTDPAQWSGNVLFIHKDAY